MAPPASEGGVPPGKAELPLPGPSHKFFVWKEFVWGGLAGAFGEGMMHPIDTLKTRIQSQAVITACQSQKNVFHMIRSVRMTDGLRGFYRGVTPGVTGSLATGATYFGVIESTKKWLEVEHPNLGGHWSHFIAGAVGDTLGSFVYVPCEVIKQRMQVQGTRKSWNSIMSKGSLPQKQMYCYYTGMFQAGRSILQEHGLKGLYAGYWSTLARDVPFAGLMVTFYEALKDLTEYGKNAWLPRSNLQMGGSFEGHLQMGGSFEGLLLGGLAGGFAAFLTTPLDVVKTRLQVQGSTVRYNGWSDAIRRIWVAEGLRGQFRGSVPRIIWYIPASALTFMAVEFLRDQFNDALDADAHEVASISIDRGSKIQEAT